MDSGSVQTESGDTGSAGVEGLEGSAGKKSFCSTSASWASTLQKRVWLNWSAREILFPNSANYLPEIQQGFVSLRIVKSPAEIKVTTDGKIFKVTIYKQGVVAHAFNPPSWKQKQTDLWKSETSLVYIMCSTPSMVMSGNPDSKKQNKTKPTRRRAVSKHGSCPDSRWSTRTSDAQALRQHRGWPNSLGGKCHLIWPTACRQCEVCWWPVILLASPRADAERMLQEGNPEHSGNPQVSIYSQTQALMPHSRPQPLHLLSPGEPIQTSIQEGVATKPPWSC